MFKKFDYSFDQNKEQEFVFFYKINGEFSSPFKNVTSTTNGGSSLNTVDPVV